MPLLDLPEASQPVDSVRFVVSLACVERVRQIDIAKQAGVSRSTVSLALNRSPLIPKETQERILALANELGYERDPALSVLSDYRRKVARKNYRGTLALVSTVQIQERFLESDRGLVGNSCHFGEVATLEEEARRLGYALEFFNLGKTPKEHRRVSNVLYSRGITGIIVAPRPEPIAELDLEWELFSAVQLSGGVRYGPLNRVHPDHFDEVMRALDELKKRGYERPVMLEFCSKGDPVIERYTGSYTQEIHRFPDAFPVQYCRSYDEAFSWYQRNRPDAVVCRGAGVFAKFLTEKGINVPGELGCCDLHLNPEVTTGASGFLQALPEIAIQAVRLLDSMLVQKERGFPEHPLTLEIAGTWVEGTTLRPRLRA